MKKLLAIIAILASTGCSTLTNGTTQQLHISGGPCTVVQDAELVAMVESESHVTVQRSQKPLHVACGERVTEYKPEVTAAGWTSIGLIDFGLVDYLTGALWGYSEVKE